MKFTKKGKNSQIREINVPISKEARGKREGEENKEKDEHRGTENAEGHRGKERI
jgi:hypothetical protein